MPSLDEMLRDAVGDVDDEFDIDELIGRANTRRSRRRRHRVAVATFVVLAVAVAAADALTPNQGDGPETMTAPTSSGACEPRTADRGIVAAGTLDDGGRWEVRAGGQPPNETISASIDGETVGGSIGDERSQPGRINEGLLPLGVEVTERGVLVYGQVPSATTDIEVSVEHGDVAYACPVTVPTDDLVSYFGAALPPGTRPTAARALDAQERVLASGIISGLLPDTVPSGAHTTMNVDPDLVSLPLGGSRVEIPERHMAVIVSGEVSSGSWALSAGQRDDTVILELRMPSGVTGASAEGTPDQLLDIERRWRVKAAGNQFVVWGRVPPDVTSVTINLDDGSSIDASTVEAVPGVPLRAFAASVPVGATVTDVEEHRRDGSTANAADDVASQLDEMSDAVSAASGSTESVAVYAVDGPENAEREAFIEAAGTYAFEGPASCWTELPGRLGVSADAQVLAVAAASEERLGEIMTRLPGEPVLTGRFVRTCPAGH